jgi:hypothetical protein
MYNLKSNNVTNYLYNSLIELVVLKPKSAYNTSNDYQSVIEEWAMFCSPSTTQISALQLCTRIDDLTPYFSCTQHFTVQDDKPRLSGCRSKRFGGATLGYLSPIGFGLRTYGHLANKWRFTEQRARRST